MYSKQLKFFVFFLMLVWQLPHRVVIHPVIWTNFEPPAKQAFPRGLGAIWWQNDYPVLLPSWKECLECDFICPPPQFCQPCHLHIYESLILYLTTQDYVAYDQKKIWFHSKSSDLVAQDWPVFPWTASSRSHFPTKMEDSLWNSELLLGKTIKVKHQKQKLVTVRDYLTTYSVCRSED